MSDRGWCALAAVCVWMLHTLAVAQSDSSLAEAPAPAAPHVPVRFLHDRFQLELAGRFASASLKTRSNLPGVLGLSGFGLSGRLTGLGFRQNSVPYQAGEFYTQGGSGEDLGVRADRTEWDGESLGFPPSGADDPALLPGPQDSAYWFPVPLFGYDAAELVLWRDPELPDSAKATARYTNGPAGYSYTGGRFRSEIGAGFETDAQFYRIFSDGIADSSRFDGHNLDLELRRQWGHYPLRLRFRQNSARRDLVFRWQQDPARAAHKYYLTHLTLEGARSTSTSEWLLSYDLRVEDQEKRALSALSSYQFWFERRHRVGLSRLSLGPIAYWGAASGEYRESESGSGLPGAFMADFSAGGRLSGSRTSLLVSGGARLLQNDAALYRAALALRFELFDGDALLAYAGAARQAASTLRRYLPADSGATYAEAGDPGLPVARHASAAVAWRHERGRLAWEFAGAVGSSSDLAVWTPAGDTASLAAHYAPVAIDRSGASVSGHLLLRPVRLVEMEGSWRHQFATSSTSVEAVFSPRDSWFGALRLPISVDRVHLRITPECALTGAQGGTLPETWAAWSFGVDATLKQLTIFWHRDNALDDTFRTGGAYPSYGAHSRFGFTWDFWN